VKIVNGLATYLCPGHPCGSLAGGEKGLSTAFFRHSFLAWLDVPACNVVAVYMLLFETFWQSLPLAMQRQQPKLYFQQQG